MTVHLLSRRDIGDLDDFTGKAAEHGAAPFANGVGRKVGAFCGRVRIGTDEFRKGDVRIAKKTSRQTLTP